MCFDVLSALFHAGLCCSDLFRFVVFCFVVFCFVLSCFLLSCVVLCCIVLVRFSM